MASSHPAWSYWRDATVLDDYAMTTTTSERVMDDESGDDRHELTSE